VAFAGHEQIVDHTGTPTLGHRFQRRKDKTPRSLLIEGFGGVLA